MREGLLSQKHVWKQSFVNRVANIVNSVSGRTAELDVPSSGFILSEVFTKAIMNASKLNSDTLRKHNGFAAITKLYKSPDFVYRIQIKTQDEKPLLDYLYAVPKLDP